MPETASSVIGRVLDAYAALADLGEAVEDEWSYVQDLTAAWRERLESAADGQAAVALDAPTAAAVDRAIDEVGAISDPHRAIDWLSTFPQVVLLALGEPP